MKQALDEGARYGWLAPMAAAVNPTLIHYPGRNPTTFTLRSKTSSESPGPFVNTPGTPHLTLHQYRQFQQSSALSASPNLDFKRVRRRKSCAHLSRASFESAPSLQQTTSSLPTSHTNSSQSFLHPLLPPLPSTPVPRPGLKAPSLSSTVDTLQSTPTQTPVYHGGPIAGLWKGFESIELGEPIRTKRKFPLFKRAKRLPHHTASGGGGQAIWEVHAVVVDIGGFAASGKPEVLERGDLSDSAGEGAALKTSRKQGRSVRFKGINDDNGSKQSQVLQSLHSEEEKNPSLSSSFSLSKFAFPEPPVRTLEGTFGQYGEPTPPTSPATLHYKGASFDLVNPHESLDLGSSKIETPAEIDGLLDDYFHSTFDLATMMPYDDFTGEMSSSQQSLPTANSSNGRRRVVYDDTESARRGIMGIEDSSEPPAEGKNLSQDSPLANRPPLHPGRTWLPGSPGMWSLPERYYTPAPLNIRRNLREALHRGAATNPNEFLPNYAELGDSAEARNIPEAGGTRDAETGSAGPSEDANQAVAVDRGSSLYPHSQRSDPFQLTVSDLDNESRFNKIDEVVSGGRRSSYYAGPATNNEHAEGFQVHEDVAEDVADADATENEPEPDDTLARLIRCYDYDGENTNLLMEEEERLRQAGHPDYQPFQAGRGRLRDLDVFQDQAEDSFGRTRNLPQPLRHYTQLSYPLVPLDMAYGHPGSRWRIPGPPNVPPPPLPPMASRAAAQRRTCLESTEMPSSEWTYGNTGQLLQLTPQPGYYTPHSAYAHPQFPVPPGEIFPYRVVENAQHRQVVRRAHFDTGEGTQLGYDEDEDRENIPPTSSRAGMQQGVQSSQFVPQHQPRSSSVYPEDDDAWESTQASESRADFSDPNAPARSDEERPSVESYANTSRCSTDHRLSLPRQAPTGATASTRPVQHPPATRDDPSYHIHQGVVSSGRGRAVQMDDRYLGSIPEGQSASVFTVGQNSPTTPEETKTNPARQALGFIAEKLGLSKTSPSKTNYSPKASFTKATQLGLIREAHQSVSSDTQGLLRHPATPHMSGALRFSDTTNPSTQSPRKPVSAVKPYSPLNPTPITDRALLRDRAAIDLSHTPIARPGQETPISDTIEMRRMRKKKPTHVSRAAMSSQTELQPLTLIESTASAATGRLTASQLADAEPGWTVEPDFSNSGALAQRFRRADGFGIQQTDGTVERVSLLMRPQQARSISTHRLQKQLTRPYFRGCALCPLTALLFGLGGLDWRMKQMTKGRITEMSPTAKKQALQVYLPLGLLVWAAFGIMIAMIIIVA